LPVEPELEQFEHVEVPAHQRVIEGGLLRIAERARPPQLQVAGQVHRAQLRQTARDGRAVRDPAHLKGEARASDAVARLGLRLAQVVRQHGPRVADAVEDDDRARRVGADVRRRQPAQEADRDLVPGRQLTQPQRPRAPQLAQRIDDEVGQLPRVVRVTAHDRGAIERRVAEAADLHDAGVRAARERGRGAELTRVVVAQREHPRLPLGVRILPSLQPRQPCARVRSDVRVQTFERRARVRFAQVDGRRTGSRPFGGRASQQLTKRAVYACVHEPDGRLLAALQDDATANLHRAYMRRAALADERTAPGISCDLRRPRPG
jgi:hypothetical protein